MRKILGSIGALTLLATVALGASSPGSATASPAVVGEPSGWTVKAMTYNVLYADAAASGKFPRVPAADLDWDLRDDQLVEWIRHEGPDVIGFQENLDEVELDGRNVLQLNTVAPLLADFAFVRLDNDNPIAFRTSRFRLIGDGATRIASADGGRTILRDRWVTHATLQDRASGRQFIVFNTHLSAAAEGDKAAAARAAQAKRVTTVVRSVSKDLAIPFVVTGDLNVKDGSTGKAGAPLAELAGAGLVNSSGWAVQDTGDIPGAVSVQSMTAMVNGTRTYKAVRTSGSTLDYVWAPRGAVVKTYKVSTGPHTVQRTIDGVRYWFYADDKILPSDHNPVVVEVAFNDSIATLGSTATRAGSHKLAGKVYETYLRKGGWDVFGLPVTNRWRATYKGIGVWTQRFANGTIQWSTRAVRASVSPATTSISGTSGFRDALAASTLKAGVIYRSGELRNSTTTGRALLSGLLHEGRIIDLRTGPERSRRPDPTLPEVSRSSYPVAATGSPGDLVASSGSRAAYRKVLAKVAAAPGSILLHCSDNRVRTGWAVALIMYAAGASDTDVEAEYTRTAGATTAQVSAAISKAKHDYGSMHGFLTDGLGLSERQISAIRAKAT